MEYMELTPKDNQKGAKLPHKRGMPMWPVDITNKLPGLSEPVYIPPETPAPWEKSFCEISSGCGKTSQNLFHNIVAWPPQYLQKNE